MARQEATCWACGAAWDVPERRPGPGGSPPAAIRFAVIDELPAALNADHPTFAGLPREAAS
jgi:hypothetical protein